VARVRFGLMQSAIHAFHGAFCTLYCSRRFVIEYPRDAVIALRIALQSFLIAG